MLVLDASAAVDLLLRAPHSGQLRRAIDGQEIIAPELIDADVLSAVGRHERAGTINSGHADRAMETFRDLPLTRVSHVLLTEAVWRYRRRVRIADGFYVACAVLTGAQLVTTDGRLARAPLPGVSILLVR
ncbi:MAG TPA: type II toxin-antitoxin system VapC family toxin [Jatrophihabitantaceae bacterium]|nr:type II toxin-antitoxin system VapC family toxin [Jatrophihabitantaceae bacterium]